MSSILDKFTPSSKFFTKLSCNCFLPVPPRSKAFNNVSLYSVLKPSFNLPAVPNNLGVFLKNIPLPCSKLNPFSKVALL